MLEISIAILIFFIWTFFSLTFHKKFKILQLSINNKKNQHLASLRDWLLPMLMNCQVTVGEVE